MTRRHDGYAVIMTATDITNFTETSSDVNVKEFEEPKDIVFRLRDQLFYAAPELSVDAALEFTSLIMTFDDKDAGLQERVDAMRRLIQMLMLPESAERFLALTAKTASRPLGYRTVIDVMKWLFEQYGGGPTTPDSDSSSGSGSLESGTSSTVNTSAEA